jgi:hypothetical protein
MAVTVLDGDGKRLSPCSEERAAALVAAGKARLVSESPQVIQIAAVVSLPQPQPPGAESLLGRRILLHICCAPCATFTAQHLGARGAAVTGYWYNPNIQPYSEHEKRRGTLARYAEEVGLSVLWEPRYDTVSFLRCVVGHEGPGERCALCYRLRLEQTASAAARGGFDLFSTTLLISPYQQVEAIRAIGEELSQCHGVSFYFENLRRGFSEHHRLAREHSLYQQRYCGCLYSEWESLDPAAPTRRRDPKG